MQDITDLPFMQVVSEFGGPDYYVTEYFRVHQDSRLDPYILRSIVENPTGKPVFAQMIGQDIPALVRSARELQKYPVAGIDLNLGCPAPVVCRKDAGGGLLRKPEKTSEIIARLRDACTEIPFTVKTRLGFYSPDEFDTLLDLFARHPIDLLTIHARTVHERYQTPVHPEKIRQAAETLTCPVIANGNVINTETARRYLDLTKADGIMIGRGAIRHPWIFEQIRATFTGEKPPARDTRDLLHYIHRLYEESARHIPDFIEDKHVQRMKKYLVFMTQGHSPDFEYEIRRAKNKSEFFQICRTHLDHESPLPDLPPENSRLFCGFSDLLEKKEQSQTN